MGVQPGGAARRRKHRVETHQRATGPAPRVTGTSDRRHRVSYAPNSGYTAASRQVKRWAKSRLTRCKKDREPLQPEARQKWSLDRESSEHYRATALSRVLENRILGMFGRKPNKRGTSGHGQPL